MTQEARGSENPRVQFGLNPNTTRPGQGGVRRPDLGRDQRREETQFKHYARERKAIRQEEAERRREETQFKHYARERKAIRQEEAERRRIEAQFNRYTGVEKANARAEKAERRRIEAQFNRYTGVEKANARAEKANADHDQPRPLEAPVPFRLQPQVVPQRLSLFESKSDEVDK
ncbi:hypothetical protein [Dictyobacter aurantiacus]|uniref:Uncharacterized protein n=1 Tax=Dictyobacter aurantiacus TaxID=1936993 RepID=A0A401Z9M4_9CHLR|nr:hypothetical protein [Dictyobacter aurantiacus]GCE03508.1 hypothetical protein KDAU_08370 [Dictyobacter aurantiacus]